MVACVWPAVAILLLCLHAAIGADPHQCSLHPDLLARIRKDLAPWGKTGIGVDSMRNISRFCPESASDPNFCSNKYLRFTIDNGTLYFNNLIPRSKGDDTTRASRAPSGFGKHACMR